MSRAALVALACLLLAVVAASLRPAADARHVALVFRPGTTADAMLATAVGMGLLPVRQAGGWPVMIAATTGRGWQAGDDAGPVLLAVGVDGVTGCAAGTLPHAGPSTPATPMGQPRDA
jgi:hypothetical protein